MSRGRTTLYDEPEIKKINQTKGRNKQLHEKRNSALIHRYYFFNAHTKWNYNYIIEQLSNEFYLSPATVPEILSANFDKLSEVRKQKPSIMKLQNDFPHLNWKLKP